MKAILAFVTIVILSFAITVMVRLGAFRTVTVTTTDEGPIKMVYKAHLGQYQKIEPVIEEVETWAHGHGEACRHSFGEYLDDPSNVAEDRLHSLAGCIVEKDWTTGLPEGFSYRELERKPYVTADFDGAPSISPLKVYPKVQSYMKEHALLQRGPVIEIYEVLPGQRVKTHYLFPIAPAAASR